MLVDQIIRETVKISKRTGKIPQQVLVEKSMVKVDVIIPKKTIQTIESVLYMLR